MQYVTPVYKPLPPERVYRLVTTYTTTPVAAAPSYTLPMQVESRPPNVHVVPPLQAPAYYAYSPQGYTSQAQYANPPQEGVVTEDLGSWQAAWEAAEAAVGEVRGGAEPRDPERPPEDNQFMSLLEALEARVDLMSQMQLTRAAIQRQAQEDTDVVPSDYALNDYARERLCAELQAPANYYAQELPMQQELQGAYGEEAAQNAAMGIEMRAQFEDQRECITRLAGEVRDMRRKLLALGTEEEVSAAAAEDWEEQRRASSSAAGRPSAAGRSLDETQPVGPSVVAMVVEEAGPQTPVARRTAPVPVGDHVLPFSPDACGVNLSLSEDGYLASRMRGCRQSVAIGSGPLPAQAWGCYFEVEVRETVAGWVGGLGIGVTGTSPEALRRVPDKAWRMPNSFIVGYWGCIFLDGKEHRTAWRSDSLCAGSRVGLLATRDGRGDLIVFVNDRPVVRADGALLGDGVGAPTWEEPLYPVVDVFAATRVVALSRRASPPEPPWYVDESLARPSPPGSPVSVARSLCATSAVGSTLRFT